MKNKISQKFSELIFVYKFLASFGLQKKFYICILLFFFQACWEVVVISAFAPFLESLISPAASVGDIASKSGYINFIYSLFGKIDKEHQMLAGFVMTSISLFLKSLITIGVMHYRTKVSTLFIWKMRERAFNRLSECSMSFFDNQKKGELIQMIINETRACYSLLKSFFNMLVWSLVSFTYFILMWLMSPALSVTIFLICSGYIILNYFMSSKLVKPSAAIFTQKNRILTSIAEEGIGGVKQIKLLGYYKPMQESFSKACYEADFANRRAGLVIEWQTAISYFVGVIAFFVLIGFNSKMALLTIGALLTFLYIIKSLISSLSTVNKQYGFLNVNLPAVENIKKFFAQADRNKEESGERLKTHFLENKISLRSVSLDYGKGKVLEDITLDIPKGISIAFVGESGAGKTSLVNLLPKLYRVNEGTITVDGVDIKEFDLEYLRSKIAVVNQDTTLFNKSIRENILIARPDATDAQIQEASKNAFAHEFIEELPDKYDTVVGDRGVKLSGGQRQRVNIAQAFLKDAEVLIFDEATSALDTKSEKYIQKAIEKLEKNKTSIVIAHRLSTIKGVDLIVVLDKGKIVEQGTWNFLLEKRGYFYEMLQHQSFQL